MALSFGIPLDSSDEQEQAFAAIQTWAAKLDGLGRWVHVPYDASLFTADSGTWIPSSGQVYNLAYAVVGNQMTVAFNIGPGALSASGSASLVYIRIPAPYKTVPIPIPAYIETANSAWGNQCLIWRDLNTYVPGTVVLMNQTTIQLKFLPTAEGLIGNVAASVGVFGEITFEVRAQ